MPTAYSYFQGEFVPLEDAKISVMTHALHYGTGVFEGIRANWNPEQNAASLFRLPEHYERFLQGSNFLRMQLPYSVNDLIEQTKTLVAKCGL